MTCFNPKDKKDFVELILACTLIIITGLLFSIYVYLNHKKLERFVSFHKSVSGLPPSVNLSIKRNDKILFQKSFYPDRRSIYLVNDFNWDRYSNDLSIFFQVNKNKNEKKNRPGSFVLYRFTNFNIVLYQEYLFAFANNNYSPKELVYLKKNIGSVFKVFLGETSEKELIQRFLTSSEQIIEFGPGDGKKKRFIKPAAGSLKKNCIYEIVFEYKTVGDPLGYFGLTFKKQDGREVYYSEALSSSNKCYKKASFIFAPPYDSNQPAVVLTNKRNRKKEGIVFFKNIVVYKYVNTDPVLSKHRGTKLVYYDFYEKIAGEFIDKKVFYRESWQ